MENILNLLFPQKCFFCYKNIGSICSDCIKKLEIAGESICLICGMPSIEGKTHLSCKNELNPSHLYFYYEYKGMVQKSIKRSKYNPRLFSILNIMTQYVPRLSYFSELKDKNYVLLPIPLSNKRFRERGFNQAELIARVLAKSNSLRLDSKCLLRKKETIVQYKMHKLERVENMKNAFVLNKSVQGGLFLIVDDICTSGATFLEASSVLYKAGAKDVRCFALAKKF